MKTLRNTLGWLVAPALALRLLPSGWSDALLYNRSLILDGQLWRLWTGHWVHFSSSHMIWNLIALVPAALWFEHLRPGRLMVFGLIAAPLISAGLLLGAPNMHTYGGLSGLGTAVITLLGWTLLRENQRLIGGALLALIATKLAFDGFSGAALLSDFGHAAIRPATLAHVLGAAAGSLYPTGPAEPAAQSETKFANNR